MHLWRCASYLRFFSCRSGAPERSVLPVAADLPDWVSLFILCLFVRLRQEVDRAYTYISLLSQGLGRILGVVSSVPIPQSSLFRGYYLESVVAIILESSTPATLCYAVGDWCRRVVCTIRFRSISCFGTKYLVFSDTSRSWRSLAPDFVPIAEYALRPIQFFVYVEDWAVWLDN